MKANSRLVALLIGFCATHGITPDTTNTWAAWKTFKSFARATAEVPDQGISVQLIPESDEGDAGRLLFLKQELSGDGDWLTPTGGVVWESKVARKPAEKWEELELWSFDFNSFDAFVDAVEQHEILSRILAREALASRLYWEHNRGYDA